MQIKEILNKMVLTVFLSTLTVSSFAALLHSTDVILGSVNHHTFIDNQTGYRWLNVTEFYGADYFEQLALLGGGFDAATGQEVDAMIMSVVNAPSYNFFTDLAAFTGYYATGDIIDARVADGTSFARHELRTIANGDTNITTSDEKDFFSSTSLGMWAVNKDVAGIPISSTLSLILLGSLVLLAKIHRRKQAPLTPPIRLNSSAASA